MPSRSWSCDTSMQPCPEKAKTRESCAWESLTSHCTASRILSCKNSAMLFRMQTNGQSNWDRRVQPQTNVAEGSSRTADAWSEANIEIQPWLASTPSEVAHHAVRRCRQPGTCTMEQYYGNDIDTIFIRETLMAICPVRKA